MNYMKYCILVCERMFGVGCLPLHNLKFLLTKVFSKFEVYLLNFHEEFQQRIGVHHCYNHLPIFDGGLMPTFSSCNPSANDVLLMSFEHFDPTSPPTSTILVCRFGLLVINITHAWALLQAFLNYGFDFHKSLINGCHFLNKILKKSVKFLQSTHSHKRNQCKLSLTQK